MKLKEVMHRPVFVRMDAPLWKVAREMKVRQVEFLPVVDRGVPIGSVTIRDLALAIALEAKCPYATKVSEIMTASPVALEQHADVKEAAAIMRRKKVGRLFVTDDKRILRGVVTSQDVEARPARKRAAPTRSAVMI